MGNCRNCTEVVRGNFCQNCGEPAVLEQIDKRYFARELRGAFGVQHGFFRSVGKLLVNPGENARQYVRDDRNKFVKPVVFLLFSSFVYSLVYGFFGKKISALVLDENPSAYNSMTTWMTDNAGYVNLILSILAAFFIRAIFRRYKFNIYEIFVLMCFLTGTATVVYSIFVVTSSFLSSTVVETVNSCLTLVILIYYTWGIDAFFDKKKAGNYVKAFISNLIPMALLMIAMAIALGMDSNTAPTPP